MVDIAEIGYKADTSDLERAEKTLLKQKPAAEKAEKASQKLEKQTKKTNSVFGKLAGGGTKLNTVFGRLASGGLAKLKSGLLGIASGVLAGFAFSSLISGARNLSKALAELATLTGGGTVRLKEMQKAARDMADEFGTNAAFQLKAFYGAVSAGATDAASAIRIVDQANKLAIGGITDVSTGVDILTTATNAYAKSGLLASAASDALFVGMKAGKTTIRELSSGLGQVIPIASALGVEFDELVAATAALTLQGLSTGNAITSLRAILSAIAKPASEASKLAKKLGIDFSATALKTKGLAGFLEDVIQKTGGSSSSLAILFGSVEALNAALAFAGSGGKAFNDILDDMKNKFGATDEAFNVVADSLDFRWNKLLQAAANQAADFGTKVLSVLVPIGEGIQRLFNGTSKLIPVLKEAGIALTIMFSPLILASLVSLVGTVGSLVVAIGTGLVGAIGAATSAMIAFTLANPFTAILFAITTTVAAVYLFRDEISKVLGIDIVAASKAGGNAIIATFVGGYNVITKTWSQLPAAIGDRVIQTVNLTISGITSMVNSAISAMNSLISNLPSFLGGGGANTIGSISTSQISNPFKGAVKNIVADIKKEIDTAFQTDFIGNFANEVSKVTTEITSTDGAAKKLSQTISTLGGGGGASSGSGGGGATALTQLQKIANDFGKLSEPFDQATSAFNAAKTALDNGIITNDQYAQSLMRIRDAFVATGGTSSQWAKIVGSNTNDVADKMKDLAENSLNDLGDEFIELALTGKANFADLAQSIIRDLLKIAFQALVVKPLLGAFGNFGGGGKSGGLLSIFGFAKGGGFDNSQVHSFAKGGDFTNSIVSQRTPFSFARGGALGEMGEAGPEAVMPLQRGSDGSLGVQMFGAGKGARAPSNVEVTNVYQIEGAVSEEKVINTIRNAGEQTKNDVKQSLISWLQEYETDGVMI